MRDEPSDELPGDPEQVAREILLRALTAQARTRRELSELLAKKGIPDDAAAAVLERFEDVGLIDDTAFAAAWVTSRQQRKHLSRRALRAELQRKGVDRDTISAAVDGVSPDDEYAAALDLARQRAPRLSGLDPLVRRRRLQGLLARRGFSAGVVVGACNAALGELDEAESDGDGLESGSDAWD